MGYIIETKDLTKRFSVKSAGAKMSFIHAFSPRSLKRNFVAVDHVNLKIRRGEFFGLVGPNGAGKTTLLSTISGLYIPDEGYAIVDGHDSTREWRYVLSRLISFPTFITENVAWLTGRQYLRYWARFYGAPEPVEPRLNELLRLMELEAWADERIMKYSTGMQRKLELILSLTRRVPIIFLDEPTVHLDPISARRYHDILKYIARQEDVTFILTSHNMGEVEYCCERVAFMFKGKIIAVDSPENLKKKIMEKKILCIESFRSAKDFTERLKGLPGLLKVEEAERENGLTLFKVHIPKDSDDLLNEIIKTFISSSVKIINFRSYHINSLRICLTS